MTTETQAQFARRVGVAKSWITKLKAEGRIVMTDDGKVDVEASLERMAGTNGAPERAAVVTHTFSDARDKKEHYLAENARLDYEERCGKLMQAGAVVAAIADAATTLRTRLEAFPDVLAPQLAAIADEQQVRAILADQVEIVLGELSARFAETAKEMPA